MKALVTSSLCLLCPTHVTSAPVLSHSHGPLLTSWKSGVRVDMGTHLSIHCMVSVSPFLQSICDLLCLTVVVSWTAFDIWHFLSSASE